MASFPRFLCYILCTFSVGLVFGMLTVYVIDDVADDQLLSSNFSPLRANLFVQNGSAYRRLWQFDFVISHYKEKLDWLKPVAKYCHVYDKGHERSLKPSFPVKHWEELPNVGRESHTYLYHIIKNYENLANVTIFLQGDLEEHAPNFCFPTPMEYLDKALDGIPCIQHKLQIDWGRIQHLDKWKLEYDLGLMRHAKHATLGEFYRAVFGRAPPQFADCCLSGCFSATRRCLQKHPKKFYQKLITFLTDHSNPEEGHYLERLWRIIVKC
ncbi:uncharacterized protein LOC117298808 [Asterias rubens]|uniref:uncharacterized protein LOC117298808 n=1 Tax=Asterias rubens TaxID=7604 RepID=UPI0014559237|nr:uncharacterized protein LOC117298808 [Asterias rubens]